MRAFFSYQTADKVAAAEIRDFYQELDVQCFMAHDDLQVSEEWRARILEELQLARIFVAILSRNYVRSPYCLQESGIAIIRPDITIIPLTLDETVSPGFMSHIQSRKIVSGSADPGVLFAGLAKYDQGLAVELIANRLTASSSWATAEKWFDVLRPHLDRTTDEQKVEILRIASGNNQVAGAWGLRKDLRKLYAQYGGRLDGREQSYLEQMLGGS